MMCVCVCERRFSIFRCFPFYVYICVYVCATDDYIIITIAVDVVLDGRTGDISRMLVTPYIH